MERQHHHAGRNSPFEAATTAPSMPPIRGAFQETIAGEQRPKPFQQPIEQQRLLHSGLHHVINTAASITPVHGPGGPARSHSPIKAEPRPNPVSVPPIVQAAPPAPRPAEPRKTSNLFSLLNNDEPAETKPKKPPVEQPKAPMAAPQFDYRANHPPQSNVPPTSSHQVPPSRDMSSLAQAPQRPLSQPPQHRQQPHHASPPPADSAMGWNSRTGVPTAPQSVATNSPRSVSVHPGPLESVPLPSHYHDPRQPYPTAPRHATNPSTPVSTPSSASRAHLRNTSFNSPGPSQQPPQSQPSIQQHIPSLRPHPFAQRGPAPSPIPHPTQTPQDMLSQAQRNDQAHGHNQASPYPPPVHNQQHQRTSSMGTPFAGREREHERDGQYMRERVMQPGQQQPPPQQHRYPPQEHQPRYGAPPAQTAPPRNTHTPTSGAPYAPPPYQSQHSISDARQQEMYYSRNPSAPVVDRHRQEPGPATDERLRHEHNHQRYRDDHQQKIIMEQRRDDELRRQRQQQNYGSAQYFHHQR